MHFAFVCAFVHPAPFCFFMKHSLHTCPKGQPCTDLPSSQFGVTPRDPPCTKGVLPQVCNITLPDLCQTPKPSSEDTYLSDSPLAFASKGEPNAALGTAFLLDGDAQQLQVIDGVHVHVCEVGQALPLLLPGIIHLLRVGDHVAHQQPHLHEHNHDNKYNYDDGDNFRQNILSGWVIT